MIKKMKLLGMLSSMILLPFSMVVDSITHSEDANARSRGSTSSGSSGGYSRSEPQAWQGEASAYNNHKSFGQKAQHDDNYLEGPRMRMKGDGTHHDLVNFVSSADVNASSNVVEGGEEVTVHIPQSELGAGFVRNEGNNIAVK